MPQKTFHIPTLTLGDLRADKDVQTAPLEAKEELYDQFFDYHGFTAQERRPFQELMRIDHEGFNSAGSQRAYAFARAQHLREHIHAMKSGSVTGDEKTEMNLLYAQGERLLREEYLRTQRGRARALEAVAHLDVFEEDSDRLARQQEHREATLKSNERGGVLGFIGYQVPQPELSDDEKALVKRTEESRQILEDTGFDRDALSADVAELSKNTGSPIFQDSDGVLHLRPASLLKDKDKVRQEIEDSDYPRLVKAQALEAVDERADEALDSFIELVRKGGSRVKGLDAKKFGRGQTSAEFDSEQKILLQGLADVMAGRSDLFNENDLRREIVRSRNEYELDRERQRTLASEFIETEQGRGAVSTFVRSNLTNLYEGLEDVAAVPFNFAAAAGSETARQVVEGLIADKEANAGLQSFGKPVGGFTKFTNALSREIGPLIITRKVGGSAGKLGQKLKLSDTATRRLAAATAIGFGASRSAAFNIEEMIAAGASEEDTLAAGIQGFATTFVTSSFFNALGAGGVENFQKQAPAIREMLKQGMLSKLKSMGSHLGKNALGEGLEEFIDEYSNALVVAAKLPADQRKSSQQIVEDAFFAAQVSGFFGAVTNIAGAERAAPRCLLVCTRYHRGF